MAEEKHFDFIVLGGGSGGSACARRAAGYGAKVCLIDKGPTRDAAGHRTGAGFGGTCVNVGCVPKKLMYFAASTREQVVGHVEVASGYGIGVPKAAGTVDWPMLKARRDAYVAKLNVGYANNWTKAGIEILTGEATFVGPKTVRIVASADGVETLVTAPKVLIAVGGIPAMPQLPGAELAISSDGFFDLEQQPKKVDVVGAGYIAVEMAGILHGLGSEVHLFFRGDTVMRRGFDPFIVETLMNELKSHGPHLHPNCTPTALRKAKDGTTTLVVAEGKGTPAAEYAGFDCVLMAIGREPLTASLGLEKVPGVTLNTGGYIEVDQYENTGADGVYSLGDVTSTGYELTPVAIAAGRRLGDRLFGGEPKARIDYSTIATVVFSHPPIGTIGLTEPQAREEYGDTNIKVKQSRFASMLYAFNGDEAKVKTGLKLVLRLPEETVVGLHCIGPCSDEMLQGFAVAVRMGATRHDFEASMAIHPTIAEEFVTFGGWGQRDEKPVLPPYLGAGQGAPKGRMRPAAVFSAGLIAGALVASISMAVRR